VDTLEIEVDGGQPIGGVASVELEERWIVKLLVAAARRCCGTTRFVHPLTDPVVLLETGPADHLVGDSASSAAELKVRFGIHQPRGYG
jgi:hypothetical protein